MSGLDYGSSYKRKKNLELEPGVHWLEKTKKWIVRVPSQKTTGRKVISIGQYVYEQDAIDKYTEYMNGLDVL